MRWIVLALCVAGCAAAQADESIDELGAVTGSLEVDTCTSTTDYVVPWGDQYDGNAIVQVRACTEDRCEDLGHWYVEDGVVVPCNDNYSDIRIVWVAESSPF